MKEIYRNPYFDFLRGIAILMVVGIHTYPGNDQLNGTFHEIIQLIVINAFNCAVPLFLAISGYFIAKKNLNTFAECSSFWKKQIPAVYIPCLIFSLPWFVISCLSVDFEWGGVFKKLIYLFSCGYSVYYFIALIIECYILAPFLVRNNNTKTLLIVISLSVIFRGIIEYLRYPLDIELPYIIRGAFPPLLIFFYLGIYLSKHSRDYYLSLPIIMIVIGLILGIIQMQYIRINYEESGTGQKLFLYLYDIGIILLCMSRKCESLYKSNIITRLILYIGEISFGIYFTHVYLIFIVDRFFHVCGSWFLLWGTSLLFTIGIIVICKKIVPVFSRKYFGYR